MLTQKKKFGFILSPFNTTVILLSMFFINIQIKAAVEFNTLQTQRVHNLDFYKKILSGEINAHKDASKNLKKWLSVDFENTDEFIFDEISGSTSVNLKIKKKDLTDEKGYKSLGSFVTYNESCNPRSETAYYSMAVILGVDEFYRPVMSYHLGNKASNLFKIALEKSVFKGKFRNENKKKVLAAIQKDGFLRGAIKAKKPDEIFELNNVMVKIPLSSKERLNLDLPVFKLVNAKEVMPQAGKLFELKKGWVGDELTLAKELSTLFVLDLLFSQYDRFSGGNFTFTLDKNNMAHVYASDNGGSDLYFHPLIFNKNKLNVSRYDRKIVEELKTLSQFLNGGLPSYRTFVNPIQFVKEIGLVDHLSPEKNLEMLKTNLKNVLEKIQQDVSIYGDRAFFE